MNLRGALSIVACFALSACEQKIINRGYLADSADFSSIVVGKDNAYSVFSKYGSPTIRSSVLAENHEYRWMYIAKQLEKNGPLDAKVLNQKTVVITFGKNDIVKSVDLSLKDQKIDTVTDTTKTEGKTKGIVGETFGGLGKYLKKYTEKGK